MNLYITNLQSRSSYLGYTQHKPWLFPVILVASWKLSANFAPGPGHQHQVHVQVSQLKGPGLKKHLWNDLFLGDTRCHTYGVCHTYSIYIHDTTIVSSESVSFFLQMGVSFQTMAIPKGKNVMLQISVLPSFTLG